MSESFKGEMGHPIQKQAPLKHGVEEQKELVFVDTLDEKIPEAM